MRRTFRRLLRAAIAGAALMSFTMPATAEAMKVNALNFAQAETDM